MNSIGVIGDAMVDMYGRWTLPGGSALCAEICRGNLYAYVNEWFKKKFSHINMDNCLIDEMSYKVYKNNHKYDFDVIKDYSYEFQPKEDVLVFCDYGKGVLNHALLPKDKITIVDPKFRPLERWIGCTIFKLNLKEALDLTGQENLRIACAMLKSELNCQMVVITLGADGIVGHWKEYFEYRPAKINAQNSVGAGDSMAANIALYYHDGLDELAMLACDKATEFCLKERQ
jgi:bifunctional ADP-heptose synthase (sugar kinase/adenylyltransferase)